MDTADSRLGRAALIVTALLILMVAITAAIAARPRGATDIEIPAEWRAQSDYTLIILGRTSCPACEASAIFHKDLTAAAQARGVRVLAVSTSSKESPAAFAASIGVAPDRALRASPAPKNLTSVPAIVVVTRGGEILRKHEGALAPAEPRDWMKFISTLR